MSKIIAIDPGVNGGFAVIEDGKPWSAPMPTLKSGPDGREELDVAACVTFLATECQSRETHREMGEGYYEPPTIVLEQPTPMPGFGASNFTFGWHLGFWQGLIAPHAAALLLVRPKVWQKALGLAVPPEKRPKGEDKKAHSKRLREKKKAAKDRSIALCGRLFPQVKLVLPGSRVAHDGMADALLIAEYGRRTMLGGGKAVSQTHASEVGHWPEGVEAEASKPKPGVTVIHMSTDRGMKDYLEATEGPLTGDEA